MKKKTTIWIYPFIVMGFLLILTNNCKKDDDNSDVNTVKDIDGNVYHTVTIGTQVWMVENLKTTKYNDGTSIPIVIDNTEWGNLSTPGYCSYNNDAATYKNTYGALYNWFTINTGKLAPKGWHIPTDLEWTILTDYLGGTGVAGGKMKEAGTAHWALPNTGATNSSGFTALPGGSRSESGSFEYLTFVANFWSSSPSSYESCAWFRNLSSEEEGVWPEDIGPMIFGLSVRCVQD